MRISPVQQVNIDGENEQSLKQEDEQNSSSVQQDLCQHYSYLSM